MSETDATDTHQLEARLVSRLPEILTDVRAELAGDWPDYAAFLDADLDGVLEGAAEMFVHRLIVQSTDEDAEPPSSDQTLQGVFELVGRQQWEQGHDLTRLLTAYQVGARVAWRHVARTAQDLPLSPETIAVLAESVFDFVNHLSQSSTTGYVLAQGDDVRARDRYRAELAEILLSERASPAMIRAAADRARWPLPSQAAIVVFTGSDEGLSRLDPVALHVRQGELPSAIIDDPSGPRRAPLARALAGTGAIIGPSVPPDALARTVDLCRTALALASSGVLVGDPIFVDDHLDTLIVHRDARLLSFLREQVLAPLDDLPKGARARLIETLTSWLRHQGDRAAVAADLHVHPQTVSYRIARVRERFGDALDDPRERARLMLALLW